MKSILKFKNSSIALCLIYLLLIADQYHCTQIIKHQRTLNNAFNYNQSKTAKNQKEQQYEQGNQHLAITAKSVKQKIQLSRQKQADDSQSSSHKLRLYNKKHQETSKRQQLAVKVMNEMNHKVKIVFLTAILIIGLVVTVVATAVASYYNYQKGKAKKELIKLKQDQVDQIKDEKIQIQLLAQQQCINAKYLKFITNMQISSFDYEYHSAVSIINQYSTLFQKLGIYYIDSKSPNQQLQTMLTGLQQDVETFCLLENIGNSDIDLTGTDHTERLQNLETELDEMDAVQGVAFRNVQEAALKMSKEAKAQMDWKRKIFNAIFDAILSQVTTADGYAAGISDQLKEMTNTGGEAATDFFMDTTPYIAVISVVKSLGMLKLVMHGICDFAFVKNNDYWHDQCSKIGFTDQDLNIKGSWKKRFFKILGKLLTLMIVISSTVILGITIAMKAAKDKNQGFADFSSIFGCVTKGLTFLYQLVDYFITRNEEKKWEREEKLSKLYSSLFDLIITLTVTILKFAVGTAAAPFIAVIQASYSTFKAVRAWWQYRKVAKLADQERDNQKQLNAQVTVFKSIREQISLYEQCKSNVKVLQNENSVKESKEDLQLVEDLSNLHGKFTSFFTMKDTEDEDQAKLYDQVPSSAESVPQPQDAASVFVQDLCEEDANFCSKTFGNEIISKSMNAESLKNFQQKIANLKTHAFINNVIIVSNPHEEQQLREMGYQFYSDVPSTQSRVMICRGCSNEFVVTNVQIVQQSSSKKPDAQAKELVEADDQLSGKDTKAELSPFQTEDMNSHKTNWLLIAIKVKNGIEDEELDKIQQFVIKQTSSDYLVAHVKQKVISEKNSLFKQVIVLQGNCHELASEPDFIFSHQSYNYLSIFVKQDSTLEDSVIDEKITALEGCQKIKTQEINPSSGKDFYISQIDQNNLSESYTKRGYTVVNIADQINLYLKKLFQEQGNLSGTEEESENQVAEQGSIKPNALHEFLCTREQIKEKYFVDSKCTFQDEIETKNIKDDFLMSNYDYVKVSSGAIVEKFDVKYLKIKIDKNSNLADFMKGTKSNTRLENGFSESTNFAKGWSDLSQQFADFIKKTINDVSPIDPFYTFKANGDNLNAFGRKIEDLDKGNKQKHIKYLTVKFKGDQTCSKNKNEFEIQDKYLVNDNNKIKETCVLPVGKQAVPIALAYTVRISFDALSFLKKDMDIDSIAVLDDLDLSVYLSEFNACKQYKFEKDGSWFFNIGHQEFDFDFCIDILVKPSYSSGFVTYVAPKNFYQCQQAVQSFYSQGHQSNTVVNKQLSQQASLISEGFTHYNDGGEIKKAKFLSTLSQARSKYAGFLKTITIQGPSFLSSCVTVSQPVFTIYPFKLDEGKFGLIYASNEIQEADHVIGVKIHEIYYVEQIIYKAEKVNDVKNIANSPYYNNLLKYNYAIHSENMINKVGTNLIYYRVWVRYDTRQDINMDSACS